MFRKNGQGFYESKMFHNHFDQKITGMEHFQKIIKQIESEVPQKLDFNVDPRQIKMNDNGRLLLNGEGTQPFGYDFTEFAGQRFASRVGIPKIYLASLFEKGYTDLLANNVNYLIEKLPKKNNEEWFVRTQQVNDQSVIRGVLTKKYSPMDNHEVLGMINQVIGNQDFDVTNWWYDENGFHLRIVFNQLTTTIGNSPNGIEDKHKLGLHICNSETGFRCLKISGFVYRMICSNGIAIAEDLAGGYEQRHMAVSKDEMYKEIAAVLQNLEVAGAEQFKRLEKAKEIKVNDVTKEFERILRGKRFPKAYKEQVEEAFKGEAVNNIFFVTQALTDAAKNYDGDMRVQMEEVASNYLNSKTA